MGLQEEEFEDALFLEEILGVEAGSKRELVVGLLLVDDSCFDKLED